MDKTSKREADALHSYYDKAYRNLQKCEDAGKPLKSATKKAINALKHLNQQNYFDFDDEIEALEAGANYKYVIISVARKFHIYLLNHADFNTKQALNILKRNLDAKDYTKNYDKRHLYRAYLESFHYFRPCGDVTTLRNDLLHGNYFNLKGDIKTIKSNREDLIKISHTGHIKQFLGKPEAQAVKRHNE